MKLLGKKLLMTCAISLFLAGTALALPSQGTTVYMHEDWDTPYTMTDMSDGKDYSSFCLESENYFHPGYEYYVRNVGDRAKGGGGWDDNSDEYGDMVDKASKQLYAAYFSGVFDHYGSDAATMVQEAIWWSESEADGNEKAFLELTGYIGDYDISGWEFTAVNLASKKDGRWVDNQSQLVGEKVPEASSLLLLGTGLVALAGLGRRRLIK